MYRKLVMTAVLALSMVAPAKAALHFDIDVIGEFLDDSNPTYSGTFNITGAGVGRGYNPATMTITSAYANFLLWDSILFGGSETVTIDLGGSPFDYAGSFVGAVVLGDQILGSILLDLDADGILNYTVNRGSGSFKLVGAELHAKSTARSVPDTGWSLALLGLSLVGITKLRRA